MSQENVEAIRAVYERFGEGDFRASADLLDPHIFLVLSPEFAPSLTSAHGGVLYGVEAVADYTRRDLLGLHSPQLHPTGATSARRPDPSASGEVKRAPRPAHPTPAVATRCAAPDSWS
jgi:hypothetical protein